jgi:hypothetical protein
LRDFIGESPKLGKLLRIAGFDGALVCFTAKGAAESVEKGVFERVMSGQSSKNRLIIMSWFLPVLS